MNPRVLVVGRQKLYSYPNSNVIILIIIISAIIILSFTILIFISLPSFEWPEDRFQMKNIPVQLDL